MNTHFRPFRPCVVAAAFLTLLGSSYCCAGDLFHRLHHRSDCGCNPPAIQPAYVAPVTAAIPACCGAGGGLAHVGNLYGISSLYDGHADGLAPGGAPGSFLSGYEGLPNMDGGGIHHRYPYHSYRRPWAHPGTPSTNVTIVW